MQVVSSNSLAHARARACVCVCACVCAWTWAHISVCVLHMVQMCMCPHAGGGQKSAPFIVPLMFLSVDIVVPLMSYHLCVWDSVPHLGNDQLGWASWTGSLWGPPVSAVGVRCHWNGRLSLTYLVVFCSYWDDYLGGVFLFLHPPPHLNAVVTNFYV